MGLNHSRLRLAEVIYRLETRQFEIVDIVRDLKNRKGLDEKDIALLIQKLNKVKFGIQEDADVSWDVFDNRRRNSSG